MKKINQILSVGVIATILSLATQGHAQFKPSPDDGIAASPKVRQMLNEQKASQAPPAVSKDASTAGVYVRYRAVGSDGIAASPKVRQMLDEQRASAVVTTPTQGTASLAGYRSVDDDWIAASPKVRQQLNEQRAAIMVAPVK